MPNPNEALTEPNLSRKERFAHEDIPLPQTPGQRSVLNHSACRTLHAYHSERGKVNRGASGAEARGQKAKKRPGPKPVRESRRRGLRGQSQRSDRRAS